MKFICEKEKLLKAINSVVRGVPNRTTMPILEGILIQTNDNEIKLTTYDLEIGIEYVIQSKIEDVINHTNLQYDSLKQIRRLWFILSHVPKEEIYSCHTISQRDDLFARELYKSEFFDSNTSFLHDKFKLDDYWNTFMLYDIFYDLFNGKVPAWN